ncbi:MAG: lipase family protein [Deltaproteobacteria bacterium]|nr:lipase family protein [Deltaproteobacteria bacterium]
MPLLLRLLAPTTVGSLIALSGGCITTLPLPDGFNPAEATEFAELAVSAYDMRATLQAGDDWLGPDGYAMHGVHTTEQNWNDLSDEPETVPVAWLGSRDETVFVVFRGTSTSTEALLDLDITQVDFPLLSGDGGGTHEGFTERYVELHPGLRADIDGLLQTGDFARLAFTGHSLGGSIATLAAATFADEGELPVLVYSFASPRTGDRDFAARYNGLVDQSWRVTNPRDLVPGFPEESPDGLTGNAEQLFYEHVEVRTDLPFDDANGRVETDLGVGANHSSCRYLRETCELAESDEVCAAVVADHVSCQ